jgi:A/G-specific adenine glycosylase
MNSKRVQAFRRVVWDHWKKHGRHDLPWRKTRDPYKILVSEIMLQQTQVPRVLPKYKQFIRTFPTVGALAGAPLSAVLKEWSGLGYNRRGKYLHDAAKAIEKEYKGDFKKALAHPFPGVGPYTRAAVCIFAFNTQDTLIETNVRTAYFAHSHIWERRKKKIADREIVPHMELAAKGQDPRKWHWALMDYGAHLKRSGIRNNQQSTHYTKQSKFEGSLRQVRGQIIKMLGTGAHGDRALAQKLSFKESRVREALIGLARDGLVLAERGSWRIA